MVRKKRGGTGRAENSNILFCVAEKNHLVVRVLPPEISSGFGFGPRSSLVAMPEERAEKGRRRLRYLLSERRDQAEYPRPAV